METFALTFLFYLLIPAAVVFAAVYFATHNQRRTSMLHDVFLVAIIICAGVSGVVALYYLPTKLLGITSENIIFGVRVSLGVLMLIVGLVLPNKFQKYFLMLLGLFMLLVEMPFVFTNFGSYGAFILVGAAFIALIGITVWLSTRGSKNEQSN